MQCCWALRKHTTFPDVDRGVHEVVHGELARSAAGGITPYEARKSRLPHQSIFSHLSVYRFVHLDPFHVHFLYLFQRVTVLVMRFDPSESKDENRLQSMPALAACCRRRARGAARAWYRRSSSIGYHELAPCLLDRFLFQLAEQIGESKLLASAQPKPMVIQSAVSCTAAKAPPRKPF